MNDITIIQKKIYHIRGEKVMLDKELAQLYGVATRRLNEQVRRNIERFPGNFMFQLTKYEYESLRSQNAILEDGRGKHSKYLPYAFTEHGCLMASTVLNSDKAIKMSVFIIQAFVKFREILSSHSEIIKRLDDLEERAGAHDKAIHQIVAAIRQLMSPEEKPKKKIGF